MSSTDDVHTPVDAKGPPMRIVVEGEQSTENADKEPAESADTQQEGSEPPAKRMRMSGHRKEVPIEIVGEVIELLHCQPSLGARVHVFSCFSSRRLPDLEESRPEPLHLPTASEVLRSSETCRTDAASVSALKCELPSKAHTRDVG